ncbi:pantoate--beta-alanine ligase [Alkalihalobacillus sp. LMS39]|uniref:pantoate--beta-alanine ligase n=1 Tax=Alkalihalobacillus sp. LMS39 TaxID=2924032 RepID=UPI001FB26F68|nr:pantoate--beta-alanine ligase [Alkalihalobacillus sp. LMS39]UOE92312.1 pantoate--beta-alanine ligase [Alkalihalobacillus sp. LMS39]
MKIVETIQELRHILKPYREQTIGFVPTMGFLHNGHMSLVENARAQCDLVVMSIFVNPLQFGPGEDFERYPRDFKRDEQLAKEHGVDVLFYPSVEEMYPQKPAMTVVVHEGVDRLCGRTRPGHFDGVATVVLKLFGMVAPTYAYFGLKDAQQVAVIEKLVRDFNIATKVVACPILREQDGLAQSSRNVNLTDTERKNATCIYRSLQLGKQTIETGERDAANIEKMVRQHLEQTTLGQIDYVEMLAFPELAKREKAEGRLIIAVAVQYSKARLIDNVIIEV